MHLEIQLEAGLISKAFIDIGIYTFDEACKWVQSLPYRRNSTKDDELIVLKESCGTCSSKHKLIKRLAEENRIDGCTLILCMFKMSGHNTPKVKDILGQFDLAYIPEAHTYITIEGVIYDLTFSDNPEALYLKDVLFTEEITADQIKTYKVDKHKEFLKNWGEKNILPYTFEELWGIREECIKRLECKRF